MKFEQTPQNIAEASKERALSDAEKIKKGAEFKDDGRLEFTSEQIKEAKMDMAKDRRSGGDRYAAISIEKDVLRDDEFNKLETELGQIIDTLPEGVQKDMEAIMDNKDMSCVERLNEYRRILKPSFFSGKDNPLKRVSEFLKDPKIQRLMELNDEEALFFKLDMDEYKKLEQEGIVKGNGLYDSAAEMKRAQDAQREAKGRVEERMKEAMQEK